MFSCFRHFKNIEFFDVFLRTLAVLSFQDRISWPFLSFLVIQSEDAAASAEVGKDHFRSAFSLRVFDPRSEKCLRQLALPFPQEKKGFESLRNRIFENSRAGKLEVYKVTVFKTV